MNKYFKKEIKYFNVILFVIFVALTLYICFAKLGNSFLENWDEGFYAQVTKEMIKTKDFIIPHWNGDLYLDKPPLSFWFDSFFSYLLGLSEFSIRITSAISGFVTIILVVYIAFKNWGRLAAALAFSSLALNNIFIWRARTGNLDSLLTLLIFLSYVVMVQKKYKYKYLLLGLLFGLIFLQKAMIVIFPMAIFLAIEIFFNRKNLVKIYRNYLILILVFLLIAGSWLLLTVLKTKNTSFVDYFLFRSDQGVSHLDLSKFKIDYLSYAYYSLQRRFFYVFLAGLFFLIFKMNKSKELAILYFSLSLLVILSFTEKNNNWYLVPAMPFWALTVGYGGKKIVEVGSRFFNRNLIAILIFIPALYVSYKTFKVNIMSVVNTQASVSEVRSAKLIKNSSKESDRVMRLDFSYPVTLYYSDRKTYYYVKVDDYLYKLIKDNKINWIVGKKDIMDQFLKGNSSFKYKIINSGDETIAKII